ncbi:bifunctional UDP-sugar hydrolase/5'-nucleotidase [Rhizobium sp. L1K21]|uniref:bifunctional metallophosphatase/5'-nucleotidase n=1 Tax=Rhizobium sp. L1K21 TaxID=2954933 RepID=UPI0020920882|nr:bifunctional UDP-sugar hydrolase/5'-nucleotidase [Rhizobium sp. L1K21]MCO6185724.1 bifunctional metallophosphatase/5'-nucleotidase [Rhizobium sp. L1K21]
MKRALSRMSGILLATSMLCSAAVTAAQAETVKITFLGVGDVYQFDGGKTRGGLARMNAVAKAEKAANPNTIYVFDGDMLSPSLLSGLDKGQNMIDLTNMVPFDLAVPGNHEFDFGTENFIAKLKDSKYPWAAINITHADGSPIEGLGGVMWKEIEGVKVALIPVAQDTSPEVATTDDWKFESTVETAVTAAKQARDEGADLVVGVVQAPHSYDQLMLASKAFDVILSGDDHDVVIQYNGITAYVDTSIDANYMIPVDITVNVSEKDGKRRVSWEPNFRFIDTANVTPDPETEAKVKQFQEELGKELDVVIGKTETALDSRRNMVRTQETAMGDLIADAMVKASGADFAIINGGGIRGDKEYAAGTELTRRDILSELPFGNKTVVAEMTGKQILEGLENGVSMIEDGAGRFPQVSEGLKIEVDSKAAPGSRIVSASFNGEPIDPAKTYKVATNDYMLGGGDGYTAFTGSNVIVDGNNGKLMANDVMVYVREMGAVSPKVDGRIVVK